MIGSFSAMDIAASGLTAQRLRMNTIATNLANARTTKTEQGTPFKRIDPLFRAEPLNEKGGIVGQNGVSKVGVERLVRDPRPGQMVFDPEHPDANAQGYIEYPNIDVVEEMVNMITASRAYEAGVTTIESVKAMSHSALEIGR